MLFRMNNRVTLFAAPQRRGLVARMAEELSLHSLLIAEDQPDSRLLLRKLLEPQNFNRGSLCL